MVAEDDCDHELPYDVRELDVEGWSDNFLDYYADARGFPPDASEAALESLGLPGEQRDLLLREAREELERVNPDGKGGLGEAHISFVLEDEEGLLLTHAAWKDAPFTGKKGIDLVAVDPATLDVTHTEVKLDQTTDDFFASKTLERLRNQLDLERIREAHEARIGIASHLTITTILRSLLTEGRLDIPEDADPVADKDQFHRLGAVVGVVRDPWEPIIRACPCDMTEDYPCRLLLLVVSDLGERLEELTLFEIEAKESQSAS